MDLEGCKVAREFKSLNSKEFKANLKDKEIQINIKIKGNYKKIMVNSKEFKELKEFKLIQRNLRETKKLQAKLKEFQVISK